MLQTVPASGPAEFELAGGVVAHNEERTIESAVRSLLDQDLPDGVRWSRIWVVASGCTDRTAENARRLAREDPRVAVVEELDRHGKSEAIRTVVRTARGQALALLNGDARAEPGAVRELLDVARDRPAPYAVMARPVPGPAGKARWNGPLELMWQLHHDFHRQLQQEGGGAHLSDELLLVSLGPAPPLPEGVINDGSYLAVWLAQRGCPRLYAEDAQVTIEVPSNLRDHLRQRRRIHVGNRQVTALLGASPSTLADYALRQPRAAGAVIRRSVSREPAGLLRFASLAAAELASRALAGWDRIPPAKDHVRWERIERTGSSAPDRPGTHPEVPPVPPPAPAPTTFERRLRTLVEAARWFGTGVAVEELVELLPPEAPRTPGELVRWISDHPEAGQLVNGRLVSPDLGPVSVDPRRSRALRYRESAHRLVHADLARTRPWLRCIGITGSTAYGEPEVDDDLDFFVVTRTGALWWFLAVAFATLRLRRLSGRDRDRPEPCFNYVLDDATAHREFTEGSGFLFARESLSIRMLEGDPYFRGILARTPWIGREIPRLYAARTQFPGPCEPTRAPLAIRALNALIFPFLATYLHLAGLRRDARYRRTSADSARFRTQTGFHRFALQSRRFDTLRVGYDFDGRVPGSAGGSRRGSRIPVDR